MGTWVPALLLARSSVCSSHYLASRSTWWYSTGWASTCSLLRGISLTSWRGRLDERWVYLTSLQNKTKQECQRMTHFSLTADVYPLFCPPGILPVWSSSLLCCAHDCVPNAWGLDLLPGHLLLLHHPQHHRLWRLCGRYGTVTTYTINHTAGQIVYRKLLWTWVTIRLF